jgi:SAM-dependent methyltransferase
MDPPPNPPVPYVFGTSAEEIARLQNLGELLQPSTRRLLQEAGISEGMSVLDVGCGPGSVTFLAAELVGPAGSVLGIDRDPAMLDTARAYARSSGQPIVSFIQADLAELAAEAWLEPGFDAIIGRLILLHIADPTALARTLARHLRPGGVMVFSEPDLTRMGASFPPIPVLEQLCEWVRDARRALGIDFQFGLRLQHVFQDAGLPAPQLKCEAFIGSGSGVGVVWPDAPCGAERDAGRALRRNRHRGTGRTGHPLRSGPRRCSQPAQRYPGHSTSLGLGPHGTGVSHG